MDKLGVYGGMRSSYSQEDVTILLKDITGLEEPLPASVREKRIQAGTHYCEMLPLEYKPSGAYMTAYEHALSCYAKETALAVGVLAQKLVRKKGSGIVLVSLARAGIPIGILLKRYMRKKFGFSPEHYAVSIIRGRGIDRNAMRFILERHEAETLQFVDGWTGKGAILNQLKEALSEYDGVDDQIGVLADPACLTALCGTHSDILIPSSCLNAVVTGLISRTFLRDDLIGPTDFHGAAYYEEMAPDDLSDAFLSAIEKEFRFDDLPSGQGRMPGEMTDDGCCALPSGTEIVRQVAGRYRIRDINFIKPGIGETTRVLLRRIPWKIIVHPKWENAQELKHIRQLASEKNVPFETSLVDLGNYKVCGLIQDLGDI